MMFPAVCNTHQYLDIADDKIWVKLSGRYNIGGWD